MFAHTLKVESEEIFFTSGATESNHLAIKGLARAYQEKGKHIITSCIEHACVLSACADLEREGFSVTYLPVTRLGLVDPEVFRSAIRPDTILASIMFANNEIGTIQPIESLLSIARDHGVFFHTDAVAAFPFLCTNIEKFPVDALSLSPHKFYGPKGVGVLYVRGSLAPLPFLTGGAQEFNLRAGTQNIPGIVGAGKACELLEARKYDERFLIEELRNFFLEELKTLRPDVMLFGSPDQRLHGNLNIGFPGVSAEELLIKLDLAGIAVSLGSACSAGSRVRSHVITALGVDDEVARTSLRITLGRTTTKEEILYCIKTLRDILGVSA
jgi:cysteine desulfurase